MPDVQAEALLAAMRLHVETLGVSRALFFGPYEHIGRSQAIYVPGLAANYTLLKTLLQQAPCGAVKASQLRDAFVNCSALYAGLHTGPLSRDLWAGHKGDQVLTMLCHLRRYKVDQTKRRQTRANATDEELRLVDELCEMLQVVADGFTTGSSSSSCLSEGGTPQPTRVLKREISLDSDGLPAMLGCPRKRPVPGPPAKKIKQTDLAALLAADDLFATAVADLSAADFAPCVGRPSQEDAPAMPTGAAASRPAEEFSCKAWGQLFITRAAAQSYIQIKDQETGSKKLVVSLPASKFQDHRGDGLHIARWICKQPKTLRKEAVVEYRDALLKKAQGDWALGAAVVLGLGVCRKKNMFCDQGP